MYPKYPISDKGRNREFKVINQCQALGVYLKRPFSNKHWVLGVYLN